jgi:Cysteine rich repeat
MKEGKLKQINRFCLATLVAGLLCMGLILGNNATAAEKNPCSQDIAKFCKDVKPDRRAIMDCLEEHENELSDACKDYEARLEGKRGEATEQIRQYKAFLQACKDDVAKFCREVNPANGGIEKCLDKHADNLSTPCSASLKAVKGEIKKTQ